MFERARKYGCQTCTRAGPTGALANWTVPLGPVFAAHALSETTMKAVMASWMLQPTATTPGLSKWTERDWFLANSFSSNRLAAEKE